MRKDVPTVKYLKDNSIFADVFNYYMYGGEQVIKPDMLHEKDPTELILPFGKDGKLYPNKKYRDVLKYVTAKTDGNIAYLILGIEAQDKMHFAMPVRNMLYDSSQYANQVEEIAKKHKENIEKKIELSKNVSSGEYMSGFYRTDKLTPVITLVVYFGAEKWTAPTSVYEMLETSDPKVLKYVSDYKINLLTPESVSEKDFDKFQTELKQVLKLIKHSKDKEDLTRTVNGEEYQSVSPYSANLMSAILGFKFKFKKRKGNVNMCKAVEDMLADAKAEGIAEERERSCKAVEDMLADAKAEGKRETAIKSLKANIPAETIVEITNLPLEEILRLAEELKTSGAK